MRQATPEGRRAPDYLKEEKPRTAGRKVGFARKSPGQEEGLLVDSNRNLENNSNHFLQNFPKK